MVIVDMGEHPFGMFIVPYSGNVCYCLEEQRFEKPNKDKKGEAIPPVSEGTGFLA
jgi:hypothetical protein